MTRSVALISLLLGACSVGEVDIGGGGPDGGGGGANVELTCTARVAAPPAAYNHTSAPTGTRAGQGCVAAGCHLTGNTGAGASAFAFAGTAYNAMGGTAPAAGITIHMYKAADKKSAASAVTDSAGNFIIRTGADQLPFQTLASGCGPATPIRPMLGAITSTADRNCNSGACHAVPGGAAGPIYLTN